jgi:hypothetical protein
VKQRLTGSDVPPTSTNGHQVDHHPDRGGQSTDATATPPLEAKAAASAPAPEPLHASALADTPAQRPGFQPPVRPIIREPRPETVTPAATEVKPETQPAEATASAPETPAGATEQDRPIPQFRPIRPPLGGGGPLHPPVGPSAGQPGTPGPINRTISIPARPLPQAPPARTAPATPLPTGPRQPLPVETPRPPDRNARSVTRAP